MTDQYRQLLTTIGRSANEAADQAIGFALLADDGRCAGRLASTLMQRANDDAISYVVRAYHKLDPDFQKRLVDLCPAISGSLRLASRDEAPQAKQNVIELINLSAQPSMTYILVRLLHDDLPAVRTQAAEALQRLAERLLEQLERETAPEELGQSPKEPSAALRAQLHQYCIAIENGLDSFSAHLRTELVESAMYLAAYLPDNVWAKFAQPRSRVGHAAVEILQRTSDRRLAAFAFRALLEDELVRPVAKIISGVASNDFMREWLRHGWYRHHCIERKHLGWIRDFRWVLHDTGPVLKLPSALQTIFVEVLTATSTPVSRKAQVFGDLLRSPHHAVQKCAVEALTRMESPEVTALLKHVASMDRRLNYSPEAIGTARQHIRRLDASAAKKPDQPVVIDSEDANRQQFEAFWLEFDQLDAATCQANMDQLYNIDPQIVSRVRDKIRSPHSADRARALSLVKKARLFVEFERELCALCRDSDRYVRASAVSSLAEVASSEAEAVLLDAMDDPDPRVQANALEALETFSPPNLADLMVPKLESADNRVRANAIKAILRPEHALALRVLAGMLEHPDPSFRRSALWVVQRTLPLSLVKKVNKLASEDPDPQVKSKAAAAIGDLVQCWKENKQRPAKQKAAPETRTLALLLLGAETTEPQYPKLFSEPLDTTGVVVLVIFAAALVGAGLMALFGYIRQKRLEKLPAILGRPRQLLEEVQGIIELSASERRLLQRMAFQMRLPQPVSLLLCPALLVQAAHFWQQSHRTAAARQWGLSRFDALSRRVYRCSLNQLARTAEAS